MTLKDFPSFKDTPFVPRGLVLSRSGGYIHNFANMDTGEIQRGRILAEEKIKDEKQYTKVFHEGIDSIKGLSTAGLKLFCYILISLKPKRDIIVLDQKEVLEFCGYKARSSFYDSAVELLEKNILARCTGTDNTFFINVNCIFNGDRRDLIDKDQIYRNEQQTQ